MTSLELVEVKCGFGNEMIETIKAMSTSHSSLVKYCKDEFGKTPNKDPEHWADVRFKIQPSKIVIVPENI